MKEKNKKPDLILLITVSILLFFGLIMIASAGIVLSHDDFNEPYFYLKNQILKGGLFGFLIAIFFYFVPLKHIRRLAFPLFLANILLLIAVFIPGLGFEAGGAKRWINLGISTLQPAEFLKFTLIVYLAAWFSKKKEQIKTLKEGLIPFWVLMGFLGILILAQPDIGTFGIIALIAFLMFFASGAKIWQILSTVGVGGTMLLLMTKIYPHAANRVLTFLNPELDPQGIGYQMRQAIIAIGSGGLFGLGLGQSLQKYRFLPEPVGDSIMAVIGEELGFLGLLFLITLFGFLAYRGLKIAKKSNSQFASLLAIGITSWITIQAAINMAAISGLIPLTGLPLPFISYGSSSLMILLAGVGLLLNVSKHARI